MAGEKFDRSSQDVGNILALEHVNVRIPDQGLATLFYIVGLGLTRDPYLMVGTDNMWANAGQQQTQEHQGNRTLPHRQGRQSQRGEDHDSLRQQQQGFAAVAIRGLAGR